MLGPLFILAAAACAVSGQSSYQSGPQPAYGPPGYGYSYGRNLYAEVAEARARIYVLRQSDGLLNYLLNNLEVKVDAGSYFRKDFLNNVYPKIEAGMNQQDDRIAATRAQLKDLSSLFDDVDELTVRINNLIDDLKEIRAVRVDILSGIRSLQDTDLVHNQLIASLNAQIDVQAGRLNDASYKVKGNEIKAGELTDNLRPIVHIVNAEREEVFDLELTTDKRSVSFTYNTPFLSVPSLQWSIIGLHAEDLPNKDDGYGSYTSYYEPYGPKGPRKTYDDETLEGLVEVTTGAAGGSATLSDSSNGFVIQKVRIRVSAVLIDNQELKYNEATGYPAHN